MTGAQSADTLSRFVFEAAAVRGVRVRLADTSRAMLASHAYPPALARVLAELAAAAALLAAALKFDGSLILQLVGDGPVRLIVVECNPGLALRATAQWDELRVRALPDAATLYALSGDGGGSRLAITLDPRDGGPLYQGIVALEAASVASMIEHYLETSEQVASRLVLEARDDGVAGLLLQRLPGSGPEDDATWQRASRAIADAAPERIVAAVADNAGLSTLFPADDLRVFEASQPRFACSCSRSRVEGALRIAGADEIDAALRDDGKVEVRCEFCGARYHFTPDEARAVFAVPAPESPTRH
jgi:molecular chaperone Hsp33